MKKGISFRPFCGLLFFPRMGWPLLWKESMGSFYARLGLTPSAIYVFDHFMRESKYENHMFKVQSTLRTSAALEFGEPARISKRIE